MTEVFHSVHATFPSGTPAPVVVKQIAATWRRLPESGKQPFFTAHQAEVADRLREREELLASRPVRGSRGFPGAICGLNMAFPKLQNWMRCITRAASLRENCKTYHKTQNCDQPKGPLLVCGAIWCFSASLQMNLSRSSDSSSGYKLGESAPFRRLASILGAIPCTIDSDRVDIVSAARKIAPNVQPGWISSGCQWCRLCTLSSCQLCLRYLSRDHETASESSHVKRLRSS